MIFLWPSHNSWTVSTCGTLWKKILFEINWTFKQQSGSLQNNFVFFSSDVDMAIGFMNECQTSGLLNMNTNLLISSVVSLSAVHTDAFSTIIFWLRFDLHFFNLIAQTSAHYWSYRYRSSLCLIVCFCWDKKMIFRSKKYFFLCPPKQVSDIKKTYIDISNGQKFELYRSALLGFLLQSG